MFNALKDWIIINLSAYVNEKIKKPAVVWKPYIYKKSQTTSYSRKIQAAVL